MTYIDRLYDAEAVYPPDWTEGAIVLYEYARLRRLAAVAYRVSSMKRRIDGGSPKDQARDKRWSRRIEHLANQQANAWLRELPDHPKHTVVLEVLDEAELVRIAATVNWPRYVQEHHDEVRERMRLVVSWAVDEGKIRFGNRSANRFEIELERMQNAISK